MSLPWPVLSTAEWERLLAEEQRKKAARALYREDQERDDHGRFAPEGGSTDAGGGTRGQDANTDRPSDGGARPARPEPSIVRGVDAKANAAREIARHLANWEQLTGARPTPEKVTAAEAELRALPLVHGTTVAGALGAAEQGLLSYEAMRGQKRELETEMRDIREALNDAMGHEVVSEARTIARDGGSVDEFQDQLGLSREEATELADKLQEMRDIHAVLEGTTGEADRALGLDRYVFMTHGAKHQDYGNVAVIVDNAVLDQPGSFATENDIVKTPGALDPNQDFYTDAGVTRYRSTIVTGDDYYRVAAAAAGSPDYLAHRSREQLFEVKAPRVPRDAVKGFVVENDLDTAKRLADRLAAKGLTDRVLYVDEVYGAARPFMQEQLKTMQATGMWDEDALERFREEHSGTGVYIL